MFVMLKLAWRNLFRNKRRTVIAGTAIGLGLASLIFSDALIIGMEENMIRTVTASFLGEGEIHASGYRLTRDVEKTINDLDRVAADLERDSRVDRFTPRVMSLGMIASPANLGSILLVGVRPATERHLSQVDDTIVQGAFFEKENPQDILLGARLAEVLEAGIGDRVVVTTARAHSGELAQELFRVSGIFRFNSSDMDGGMAFIRIGKAREMLGLGGAAHEIALTFNDKSIPRDESHPFWSDYSQGGNEALGWPRLLPQLRMALDFSQWSLFIIAAILFALVSLGIVNTLFMSIYERIFEFGVLRAVGTRPFRVGLLILFEAGALALLSIIFGSALGFAVTFIVGKTGIDYRGVEMVGVTFRDMLYPVLTFKQFVLYPFWVMVFTIIVGIYPALYVGRIKPAEAMRRSL